MAKPTRQPLGRRVGRVCEDPGERVCGRSQAGHENPGSQRGLRVCRTLPFVLTAKPRYGRFMSTRVELPVLQVAPPPSRRVALVKRARLLAWLGLGWHVIEAGIGIAAGIVASSVALVGFGA